MASKKLVNLEVERACISAAINYQEQLVDVLPFIGEGHFDLKTHQVIFSVIKLFASRGEKFDVTLLTEKLKTLGVNLVNGIEVLDYLQSLKGGDYIQESSMMVYFKLLQKYANAREIYKTGEKLQRFVEENIEKTSSELIIGSEKVFAEKIETFKTDNEPEDLLDGMKERIEGLGNDQEEIGIRNPHKRFRDYFGDFLPGRVYFLGAPTGIGKTTWLMDLVKKVTKPDEIIALYLDTELTKEQEQDRYLSSISDVNEAYIRSGKFRLDAKMTQKIRSQWDTIESRKGTIYHEYVGRKGIDEIISICRRFKYKHSGVNKNGVKKKIIFVFDYLKGKEGMKDAFGSFTEMLDQADKLKVASVELDSPFLTAGQLNQNHTLALSSGMANVVDLLAFLKKKEPEKLQRDGPKHGTHYVEFKKSRVQGEKAMGFQDLVQLPDGNYEPMYINFEFKNFHVEEVSTLFDVVETLKSGEVDMKPESTEDPF